MAGQKFWSNRSDKEGWEDRLGRLDRRTALSAGLAAAERVFPLLAPWAEGLDPRYARDVAAALASLWRWVEGDDSVDTRALADVVGLHFPYTDDDPTTTDHLGAVMAHAALYEAILVASLPQPSEEVGSVLFDAFYAAMDPLVEGVTDTREEDVFLAGREEAEEELDLQGAWVDFVESNGKLSREKAAEMSRSVPMRAYQDSVG